MEKIKKLTKDMNFKVWYYTEYDWEVRLSARIWYSITHAWKVHLKDGSFEVYGITPLHPEPIRIWSDSNKGNVATMIKQLDSPKVDQT